MNYFPKEKEFERYAKSEFNVSSNNLDLYKKQSSLTPYILEEREMRMTQMDIFSRLMVDRLLWVAGPVNDNMSTIVQAQLMFFIFNWWGRHYNAYRFTRRICKIRFING